MRNEQTLARLADPTFRTDPVAMTAGDSQQWLRTSLVLKLPYMPTAPFFVDVSHVYAKIRALVSAYDPTVAVDIYFASAHITIKTIAEDVAQRREDLERYAALIRPLVQRWLACMAETRLYALGLFTSLNRDKGLSIGLCFYPSLPLLQIMRGEVGIALYDHISELPLRPEEKFHTMLTHSTGCRIRLRDFPLSPEFITDFQAVVESYNQHLFGLIDQLRPDDFVIRHGYSDQLIPLVEVSCA